jgi:PAS domain S-box-containing protein
MFWGIGEAEGFLAGGLVGGYEWGVQNWMGGVTDAGDELLRVRADQQALLAGLGKRALAGVGLEELLGEAVAGVARICGAEWVELLELQGDGVSGRRVEAEGQAETGGGLGEVVRLSGGLEAALAGAGVVVTGEDEGGSGKCVAVAIAGEGRVWGVLAARSGRGSWFGEEQVDFFQGVAEVISAALRRQRQDDALRASEARFRSVAEVTSDVIWDWDLESGRVWRSGNVRELLGFSAEEITVDPEMWMALIHPDDREMALGILNGAIEGSCGSFSAEYRLRRKDGGTVVVLDRAQIIRDGAGRAVRLVGGLTDLTERRGMEAALRASEGRFRELAENIREVFFNYDPAAGRLVYVSPAFEAVWGRSREGLDKDLGVLWEDVHLQDREQVATAMEEALAGRPVAVEVRVFVVGLGLRWIRVRVYPVLGAGGELVRLVGTANDVTERQGALVELARVNRALKMMSSCNENLVRATDEKLFLADTCRVAVEIGGYRMAWVGYAMDDAAKSIVPVAHYGVGSEYLLDLRLTWGEGPEGSGPGGRTIRSGQVQVCEDVFDPAGQVRYAKEAVVHGFRGIISLPLRDGDRTFGLLALLAGEVRPVSEEEVNLLKDLAGDLAFGIRHLRTQQERLRMETAVQKIAATVSAGSAGEFFPKLVRNMVEAVGARAGYVIQLDEDRPGVGRTLAGLVDGELTEAFEYDVTCVPCAEVLRTGGFVMRGLESAGAGCPAARFGTGVYAGRGLMDGSGELVGLVFVVFAEWPGHEEFIRPTLQVFADRAAAELEIEQADQRIREQASLLDKARDAIMVRDLDHRVIFWSKGAERVYGWTAEEMAGRSARELLYEDAAACDAAFEKVLREGEWAGELEQVDRYGRVLVVEGRWTLLRDAADAPKSVLSINTDVTEQRQLQQQFLRAQRLESIGTLAGGMAHDLNNVLAPISMSIELLQLKLKDKRSRELLEMISGCARRGAEMIEQVLSFGRGVEGRRVEVRVADLVGAVERLVRDTFPKNVEVVTDCPAGLWTVLGDPTQLHQVLLNLCVNARDAMSAGGMMWIRARNVAPEEAEPAQGLGSTEGAHVCVEVEDRGIGIAADVLDKVFDPFFTTKRVGEGTGLGLSTSLGIVRSHGGSMHVASRPGQGARFRFCLPAVGAGEAAENKVRALPLPRGGGQTVLVVDDEKALREITRQTLEEFGYRVLLAADGAEALELHGRHQGEIAVVVTDIMMPVLDGSELMCELRKRDARLPMIATSGFRNPDPKGESEGGADCFLAKPYTAGVLLRALEKVLAQRG